MFVITLFFFILLVLAWLYGSVVFGSLIGRYFFKDNDYLLILSILGVAMISLGLVQEFVMYLK